MATRASFQALANKLINNTFADFRDEVVLSQMGTFDYDSQTTPILDTSVLQGIRLEFQTSQFDGQSIQIGDYKIVIEEQKVGFDVRADNVKMTFNGKDVEIVRGKGDAARAANFIHARDK